MRDPLKYSLLGIGKGSSRLNTIVDTPLHSYKKSKIENKIQEKAEKVNK